ncbi:nuclear transport factor 2 family protein [Serratia entomophila]|jgi:hypothetical protein|uniref:Nuclear transport factor 2 family protein n=1 Tax=Serratia entomophila TaxID=42906 RepID=A0ABY5D1U2_9GAMM|nr:nuclear transport factor 2 family protein [Serratia entomophila]
MPPIYLRFHVARSKKEGVLTDSTRLLSEIQSLEVQLHQPATRNDVNIVAALLHEDFEEIGRSGQRYDKQQTVAALEMENGHRQIFAEEFKLANVAEGVVLLTYKSFQRDANGKIVRRTERSSIWLLSSSKTGGRWQLRFHQGTANGD